MFYALRLYGTNSKGSQITTDRGALAFLLISIKSGLVFDSRCLHQHLAFVIQMTIVFISSVPNMRLSSFCTNSDLWSSGFVMRTALVLTLFRMTTLRMCHDELIIYCFS